MARERTRPKVGTCFAMSATMDLPPYVYADERYVPGLPLEYEVTPNMEMEMVGACGYVRLPEPGEGEVIVRAGSAELRVPLHATASDG